MTGHGARSLHARVGVMFAVGGLLLAVVLGISTAVLVYPVMMDQRARTTERQVEINSRIVGQVLRDAPSGVADTLRSLDRPIPSYSLVATDGRWYASRVTADAADLPADLRAAALDGQRATRRVQLAAGPSLVAVRPLAGGAAGYVEVFPLRDIADTMQVVVLVLLLAGTVTTAVGVVLGRWAARSALRPVAALTGAAAAVAGGDLTVRMAPGHGSELGTIADAFNRTVADLRRRVEADTRFAANVSHELRTPLTTIVNAAELLHARRDALTPLDREILDLLVEEVRRFRTTVIDLLEVSTGDGTTLRAEPIAVADLARVADRVAGRPVSIVPAGAGVVTGDRRRLERVVANLVDNAERHGGGVRRVSVEHRPGTVRLLIDDAGPGIPAERREEVFERFCRLAPHRSAGSGLGLALVAEEVRRHDGRVWVEDGPCGGARFVVELAAGAAAVPALSPW